ncbi:hypothetical protein D9M71_797200 [compost metagenome]
MRDEFLPEFGNALNGLLGKCSAKPCNQQEVSVFEAWLRQFDACLLIHGSTPGAKSGFGWEYRSQTRFAQLQGVQLLDGA